MSDAIDEKLDKMIDPLSDISDKLDDVTNELTAINDRVGSAESSVDVYTPRVYEELVGIHSALAQ